jgi:signal transduction histidine kinase
VRDLHRLEQRSSATGPSVEVTTNGELADLRAPVDAASYRVAQEAVTNALRHARHATEVRVRVEGTDDHVRVTVVDDGRSSGSTPTPVPGFGLIGMAERAKLLGGTFAAGPCPGGGWSVEATFPRRDVRT